MKRIIKILIILIITLAVIVIYLSIYGIKTQKFNNEITKNVLKINKKINDAGMTSEVDLKNHNLNYKIREHSLSKIPLLLICGKKEVDSNSVTIRRLDTNKQENMELNLFLKKFSALNKAPSN